MVHLRVGQWANGKPFFVLEKCFFLLTQKKKKRFLFVCHFLVPKQLEYRCGPQTAQLYLQLNNKTAMLESPRCMFLWVN